MLHDIPVTRTLKDVLHDQIHSSQVPPKVQAEAIGTSYSYLLNSANPELETFQFQLRHLIPLCRVTQRTDVLDHILLMMGRVSFDLPRISVAPATLNESLASCFKEFSEFAQASAKSLADSRITSAEAKEIEGELLDLLRQVMSFLRMAQEAAGR